MQSVTSKGQNVPQGCLMLDKSDSHFGSNVALHQCPESHAIIHVKRAPFPGFQQLK